MPLCAELISDTVIPAASTHHRLLPPLSSSAGAKTCESNQQQKTPKGCFNHDIPKTYRGEKHCVFKLQSNLHK